MSNPIDQQHSSAGRAIGIRVSGNTAPAPTLDHAKPPTDLSVSSDGGAGATEPDIVTSPLRADGQAPCTGFMLMLKSVGGLVLGFPALVPATAAGFTMTIWVRNPVTRQWGKTASFSILYDTWMRSFDFNGGDLYFQVDVASTTLAANAFGFMDIHVVEL